MSGIRFDECESDTLGVNERTEEIERYVNGERKHFLFDNDKNGIDARISSRLDGAAVGAYRKAMERRRART